MWFLCYFSHFLCHQKIQKSKKNYKTSYQKSQRTLWVLGKVQFSELSSPRWWKLNDSNFSLIFSLFRLYPTCKSIEWIENRDWNGTLNSDIFSLCVPRDWKLFPLSSEIDRDWNAAFAGRRMGLRQLSRQIMGQVWAGPIFELLGCNSADFTHKIFNHV